MDTDQTTQNMIAIHSCTDHTDWFDHTVLHYLHSCGSLPYPSMEYLVLGKTTIVYWTPRVTSVQPIPIGFRSLKTVTWWGDNVENGKASLEMTQDWSYLEFLWISDSRDLGKDFRMRCRCSKLPWALGFSMAFPMVCMRLSFCRSSRTCWKASTKVINSSKLNDWLLTQDSLTFFDYEPLISILSDLPPTAPLLRWCEQNSIGHPDSIKATLGCRLHVSFWNTEGIYMDLRF